MIGSQELILILAIRIIVVGPKKLPEMAKGIGKAIQEFKKSSGSIADTVNSALNNEEDEGKIIVKVAGNLGIDTEGKTIRQLIEEIERKTVKNKDSDILGQ